MKTQYDAKKAAEAKAVTDARAKLKTDSDAAKKKVGDLNDAFNVALKALSKLERDGTAASDPNKYAQA